MQGVKRKSRYRALIKNKSLVEDIYGIWPSFHDAEVLSICFQRGRAVEAKIASVVIELNYWETKTLNAGTSALDFVKDKNFVITLMIDGLIDSSVLGFNFQNVIDELLITEDRGIISINAISIHGVEMDCKCRSISVLGVRPFA